MRDKSFFESSIAPLFDHLSNLCGLTWNVLPNDTAVFTKIPSV